MFTLFLISFVSYKLEVSSYSLSRYCLYVCDKIVSSVMFYMTSHLEAHIFMVSNFSNAAFDFLVKVATVRLSHCKERFSSFQSLVIWKVVICHYMEYLVPQRTTRFVHIEMVLNNSKSSPEYLFPKCVQIVIYEGIISTRNIINQIQFHQKKSQKPSENCHWIKPSTW